MPTKIVYRNISPSFILAIVALCLFFIPAKADGSRQSNRVCYYIISNTTDSVMRMVDILVDENDFTEEQLRNLMEQFREQYSEPNMLVMLYSKLEQYQRAQMGHADVMLPRKEYAGGILIYRGNDQVIRYKAASERELRTIVVKGIDPFE